MTRIAGTLGSALALLLPQLALAEWPTDPMLNVPLSTGLCYAERPVSVTDGAGGAIVAWDDCRNGQSDIFAQHVRADGIVDPNWPLGGREIASFTASQQNAAIAPDGSGGAIIAWSDLRDFTGFKIYAQHVLADGTLDPGWPVLGLEVSLTSGIYLDREPSMIPDGIGGAILSYADIRDESWSMIVHHVLASGVMDPAWPADGLSLGTTTRITEAPVSAIASDGAGGAIVSWLDDRIGNGIDVYAQRVRSIGVVDARWPASGRALCTAPDNQYEQTIMADGVGGAIVAWVDSRSGSGNDVYASRVQAGGEVSPGWPIDGRAICVAPGYQYGLAILADGTGGAFLTWTDPRAGDDSDVYSHHVLAAGNVDSNWPADGLAIITGDGYDGSGVLASDQAGGAMVAYCVPRNGATAIRAQHLSADGTLGGGTWPRDGRAVCTAGQGRGQLSTVTDGAGGMILVWADSRLGGAGIYAQRVDAYGLLGPPPVTVTTLEPRELRLTSIRPNPAARSPLSIQFELVNSGEVVAEVIDVSGRLVLSRNLGALGRGAHAGSLPGATGLAPGVYMIRLRQGTSSTAARAVVVD